MASSAMPGLHDGGLITIQRRSSTTSFRVLIIELPSTYFFSRKAKEVERTKAYFDLAEEQAANFPVYDENLVFRTSDDVDLLWLIKNAMGWTRSAGDKSIGTISLSAIESLVETYPPHLPKARSSVNVEDGLEEQKKWHDKNCEYGDYHFAYWHAKGRPYDPAKISKESRPRSDRHNHAVQSYIQATEPEHVVVSKWLRVIDPQTWGKYHDCYQALRMAGSLGHLDQGEDGCFTGQALLINVAVKPHRDHNDDRGGWVASYCFGSFKGGNAVFPELWARLGQRAGDLLFSRSAVLEHWVQKITEGQRFGNARFMKDNILNPPQPTFLCSHNCVDRKFMSQNSLNRHYKMIHPVEWAAEHPGWVPPVKRPSKRAMKGGILKR